MFGKRKLIAFGCTLVLATIVGLVCAVLEIVVLRQQPNYLGIVGLMAGITGPLGVFTVGNGIEWGARAFDKSTIDVQTAAAAQAEVPRG